MRAGNQIHVCDIDDVDRRLHYNSHHLVRRDPNVCCVDNFVQATHVYAGGR